MIPIYDRKNTEETVKKYLKTPRSINVGLAYDKFPDIWNKKGDGIERENELNGFFSEIKKLMGDCTEVEILLDDFHNRMTNLINALGGISLTLTTNWRFLTGIGNPHPSEIGFKWDRNLGVPYLPGSSIKGAVRAWMKVNSKEEAVRSILGSLESGAGNVIFLDAYPSKKPELDVDILNPHYKKYYEGDAPPADYLSPTPVYFLTVAPQTQFEFRLLPRNERTDLNEVANYLTKAAYEYGLGAKTSVGYGFFR